MRGEVQLTIIVPVYNEEDNILRVAESLSEYMKISAVPAKVVFVNDGSTDTSGELIGRVCAESDKFDFITFEKNAGLSAAIKAGFDYADTQLIGYIDSDLQTDPEDFNLLLAEIPAYDLVTGNRSKNRKDKFVKNVSSTIANKVRRMFTHDGMDDTGCPLKIIKSDYAKKMPMFRGLHRFLPAMVLLQNGKIKQVDVRHYPRTAGQAKFGVSNRVFKGFVDCFAYRWMKKNYIDYKIKDED